MNYQQIKLTKRGNELIQRTLGDGADLEFREVRLSSQSYNQDELKDLTDLDNIQQTATLSQVKRLADNNIQLSTVFNNDEVSNGFTVNTIGVYVTNPDQVEETILYGVTSTDEHPFYMAPHSVNPVSITLNLTVGIGEAENFSINVDPTGAASREDLDSVKDLVKQLAESEAEYAPRLTELAQNDADLTEQLAQAAQQLKVGDVYIKVPSDYSTLQEAFDKISDSFYAPGSKVYITIESGFKPKLGIKLKKRDYRFIELGSDDEIVEVHDDFEGNFISGSDCEFPIFNLLVDMRGKGSMGVALYANANATISDGCGVKNAGYTGVFVNRLSKLYTHDGIFSGAGTYGMFVDHVGHVYARYVNLNDSGGNGLRATKGSIVEVANAEIKNATDTAILASEGTRVIGITDPTRRDKHIDVSGSGGDGIRMVNGSEFIGDKVIINDCVGNGVYCEDGSKALMNTTTMNNIQIGAVVTRNSSLSIRDGEILNARGHGVYSSYSSTVDAPGIKVRASGVGVTLNYGCNGNVRDADLKDCRSAVNVTEGSILNANGVDGTGHTSRNAFLVYTGGIINARDALGDLRIEPNTITSDGIIFQ